MLVVNLDRSLSIWIYVVVAAIPVVFVCMELQSVPEKSKTEEENKKRAVGSACHVTRRRRGFHPWQQNREGYQGGGAQNVKKARGSSITLLP